MGSTRSMVVEVVMVMLTLTTTTHQKLTPLYGLEDKSPSRMNRETVSMSAPPKEPEFLPPGGGNVTATVDHTAYLQCRVGSLGDLAQISWIRKRDLHVLSSGLVVFASDQRVQVIHPEKSENWTLRISFAQLRDSGIYECQVNTEPKMYQSYYLTVVESRATMVGPEYVKEGSTINLTCTITQPHPLGLVHWYHNHEMLDYEGRVVITTHEGPAGLRSELTIAQAGPSHSGNYTC